MKTRQYKRLAGASRANRLQLAVEGLDAIAGNVAALADELQRCVEAQTWRSGRLTYNAAREEAGKFLVLVDAWRSPAVKQAVISRHYDRAGDHLAKLLYAQMADYSIASRAELVRALNHHRRGLYLDGPNDNDWIFRNDLLTEREGALYVDLIYAEERLQWVTPRAFPTPLSVPRCVRLVAEITSSGLITAEGLVALAGAWKGFDARQDSHCSEWRDRTRVALGALAERNLESDGLRPGAEFVARRWPMPMVELDLDVTSDSLERVIAEREAAHDARSAEEFGDDPQDFA